MGTLILLTILVIGYSKTKSNFKSRYKFVRLSNWEQYFQCATEGFYLFIYAFFFYIFFNIIIIRLNDLCYLLAICSTTPQNTSSQHSGIFIYIKNIFDIDLKETLIEYHICFIFLISWILVFIDKSINSKIDIRSQLDAILSNEESIGINQLETILITHILENQEAISDPSKNFSLLSFSLESNKVYIGLILHGYNLKFDDSSYISLLPFFSGYRKEDNHQLHLRNNYLKYSSNELDTDNQPTESNPTNVETLRNIEGKYTVTLPIKKIQSINKFDTDTYQEYIEATKRADNVEKNKIKTTLKIFKELIYKS